MYISISAALLANYPQILGEGPTFDQVKPAMGWRGSRLRELGGNLGFFSFFFGLFLSLSGV